MSASTTSTSDSVKSDTVYVSKEHGHAAFQVLNEMRTNSEHCDITLKAGNLVLSAHRVVLAALSPYFRELLLPTNNEKAEKEYVMPDSLKPGAVVAMLEFFYSGTLQINLKSIEDLLAAASTMKNQEAVRALESTAMSSISTANCLRLHDVSLKYGLYEMKNKIDRFLEWNFKNLAKEADFLKLSAGQLADIVQSENLRVRKEEVVYEAVMKWFKHDPGHRRENAEKVFQEVRFCQIPKRYLLKQVVPELVEGEKMCKDLVDGAISHQDDPKKTPGNPRKPLEAIYVISRKDNMAERYDPVQCACVPCYPLVPLEDDEEVEYRCAVVIGSDIYAVFASRVERFDPIGICWQEVGSGLDVRDAGICASKDTIYVVGGRLQGNGLQKYTIKQSTWSVGPEMNESRRLPGVTFLNNKVYVFGGYGSKGPLASAECYNVKQDKWSSIRGMRIPRFQLAATVHGGLIYVLGGRDNDADLSSVEVYDPKAKTWSKEELNMLEARNDFGVVEQNGRIYCFGGRGVATVECFDVEKKEWKTIGNTGHNNFAIDCVLFPPI